MSSQWVVASRPSSTPAAPSSSEPVHTEVVHSDVSCARRIQPTQRLVVSAASVPVPPGTTSTSGSGRSASAASALRVSIPVSVVYGPRLHRGEGDLGAGQPREHLVGPDGVEGGEAVVERDHDLHRGSPSSVVRRPPRRSGSGGGSRPG